MVNPFEEMTKNGHEAVIISTEDGVELKGKQGTVYTAHLSAAEARAEDYEAVIIPGGKSPEHLIKDQAVLSFVQQANEQGITISAICHGPQVLAAAGLLKGRTITGYPGIAEELRQAGASFVDQEVAVDNNLITSRTPEDEPAFIEQTMKRLGVAAY